MAKLGRPSPGLDDYPYWQEHWSVRRKQRVPLSWNRLSLLVWSFPQFRCEMTSLAALLTHIHIALQFFDAHHAIAAALGLIADDSLVAGFPVNE